MLSFIANFCRGVEASLNANLLKQENNTIEATYQFNLRWTICWIETKQLCHKIPITIRSYTYLSLTDSEDWEPEPAVAEEDTPDCVSFPGVHGQVEHLDGSLRTHSHYLYVRSDSIGFSLIISFFINYCKINALKGCQIMQFSCFLKISKTFSSKTS